MATIVTRAGKGSPLTNAEMDSNFTNLNNGKAELAGPVFTGNPQAPTPLTADNTVSIATTAFVKAQNYITSAGAPVQSVAGRAGVVTLAVADISGAAPLASPTFTGVAAAPTAAADTNTTQLASTAYVIGQASATNPVMNGAVAVGTSLRYARADHVHASDTSRAAVGQTFFIGTTSVAINRASGAITLTGTSIDGNAGTVAGLSVTSAATANTVASRTAAGYINAVYFNGSAPQENLAIGSVLFENSSLDGYFRKMSLANFYVNALIGHVVSWTPVLTPASGTITSVTSAGLYARIGPNLYWVAIDVTVTNAGTAAGANLSSISLPFTANSGLGTQMIHGREAGVTGSQLQGMVFNAGSTVSVQRYDNAFMPVTNSYRYSLTGIVAT